MGISFCVYSLKHFNSTIKCKSIKFYLSFKIDNENLNQKQEQIKMNDIKQKQQIQHPEADSSQMFSLNKSSKRWQSMYALRDSIRNLASCVSSRSNNITQK